MEAGVAIGLDEAARLGAVDGIFFSKYFFPETCRLPPGKHHRVMWEHLLGPSRYLNFRVFRDGAKTTLLRIFTGHRIGYGFTHTVAYMGKSETHSLRSIAWLKDKIDEKSVWATAFGLEPGGKWSETHIEIYHRPLDRIINVIALGITGSVRGININDRRPDLIVVDDPIDEENSATVETREKVNDRFFSAVKDSLAPPSEAPWAKLALLQTPIVDGDLTAVCAVDPQFVTIDFPKLDTNNESVWPERFPTESVYAERDAAVARNRYHLWVREQMCKLMSADKMAFRADMLDFYDGTEIPFAADTIIGIDPAPVQSSEAKLRQTKTDQQAIAVWSRWLGNFYLREYVLARDQDPDEVCAHLFRMVLRYRPRKIVVETVAYQRTLKWYIEKAMKEQRLYPVLEEYKDKRKKVDRITQAFQGPGSLKAIKVLSSHVEFIGQFNSYSVFSDNQLDDLLDASAMAMSAFTGVGNTYEGEYDHIAAENNIPALPEWRQFE